jgi:hypothetical protein
MSSVHNENIRSPTYYNHNISNTKPLTASPAPTPEPIRKIVTIYPYTKLPKEITKRICMLFENLTPLTTIVRQVNPEIQIIKLPALNITDLMILLLRLKNKDKIDDSKRDTFNIYPEDNKYKHNKHFNTEYSLYEFLTFYKLWKQGFSLDQCHTNSMKETIKNIEENYFSMDFTEEGRAAELLKRWTNKKQFAINIFNGLNRRANPEIKAREKNKKENFKELEHIKSLIGEIKELKRKLKTIMKSLMLASDDSTQKFYAIKFSSLSKDFRDSLVQLFPSYSLILSYPERAEKKEVKKKVQDIKDKKPITMSLEDVEDLMKQDTDDTDKKKTDKKKKEEIEQQLEHQVLTSIVESENDINSEPTKSTKSASPLLSSIFSPSDILGEVAGDSNTSILDEIESEHEEETKKNKRKYNKKEQKPEQKPEQKQKTEPTSESIKSEIIKKERLVPLSERIDSLLKGKKNDR